MDDLIRTMKLAKGPITVAYRKADGEWRCTALQFDIVGTGKTKEAAFGELRELVNEYLTHILQAKGKTAFFNPSDRDEWEAPDLVNYEVTVAMVIPKSNRTALPAQSVSFDQVRKLKRRVSNFDLTPMLFG